MEGRSSSEELLPLTAIRNVHNSFDCSTTGKPTRLFRTKCASLDSVLGPAVERTLSQLLPGANKVVNALRLRTKAFICGAGSEKMDSVVKT